MSSEWIKQVFCTSFLWLITESSWEQGDVRIRENAPREYQTQQWIFCRPQLKSGTDHEFYLWPRVIFWSPYSEYGAHALICTYIMIAFFPVRFLICINFNVTHYMDARISVRNHKIAALSHHKQRNHQLHEHPSYKFVPLKNIFSTPYSLLGKAWSEYGYVKFWHYKSQGKGPVKVITCTSLTFLDYVC